MVNWCVLRLSQIRISFRLDPEQSGQRRRAISYLLLLILHRRRPEEHQELIQLVDRHIHEMEVETMAKSMADVLREQGIEQGKTRAKQEAVIKLLQFRFSDIPKMVTDQVTLIQDISQLDLLFEEVWEADTLDEINLQNLVSEDS